MVDGQQALADQDDAADIHGRLDELERRQKKIEAMVRGIKNNLDGDTMEKEARLDEMRNIAAQHSQPIPSTTLYERFDVSDETVRQDIRQIAAEGENWRTARINGTLHLANKKKHGIGAAATAKGNA